MPVISRPQSDEYAPYYQKYLDQLPQGDVLAQLETQGAATAKLLAANDALGDFRYADGKWSVKEVVGHLSDCERVFAFRALHIGREDASELPGFDENAWTPAGRFDRRTLADVAAEFASVRAASLTLFRSFDDVALVRVGRANQNPFSVRALVAIVAGHERHHVKLLRERYGLKG